MVMLAKILLSGRLLTQLVAYLMAQLWFWAILGCLSVTRALNLFEFFSGRCLSKFVKNWSKFATTILDILRSL